MKKPNKIIAIISAIAITGTLGATVFAATTTKSTTKSTTITSTQKAPAALTDEQKAQMVAKMKERLAKELSDGKITQEQYDQMISDIESGKMPMRGDKGQKPNAEEQAKMEAVKAKWDALTADQKEEVYAISEQQIDLQIQMIDKQLSLGLIDETTATDMKAKLTEQKTNLRTDDKMPMGFGMGGFDRGFKGGDKPPVQDSTSTSTSTDTTTAE